MDSWGSGQEEKNRDKLRAEQIREGQVGSLMGVGALGVVQKIRCGLLRRGACTWRRTQEANVREKPRIKENK